MLHIMQEKLYKCFNEHVTDLSPTVTKDTVDRLDILLHTIERDQLTKEQIDMYEEIQEYFVYIVDLVMFQELLHNISIQHITIKKLGQLREQLALFVDLKQYYEKNDAKLSVLEKKYRAIESA